MDQEYLELIRWRGDHMVRNKLTVGEGLALKQHNDSIVIEIEPQLLKDILCVIEEHRPYDIGDDDQ